jgi:GT2 family glycosyltransferase
MTSSATATGGVFADERDVADCTIIIVTYNSAGDVGGLLASLPRGADGLRVRVLVVDNDSADDIAGVVARFPGVLLIPSGGNLGYSGGINVGRRHLGPTRAVLILNPDLRVAPGAIRRMCEALAQPGVGAVVPRMLGEDGHTSPSLRREPSLVRAAADGLLGAMWRNRPGWLSEMVWRRSAYDVPATVDWATGAALLVSLPADRQVGDWDEERFFLYSEETDYCRRLREAGYAIRYLPDAVVTHKGAGSGTGPALVALTAVNKLRYYRKYHGRASSAAFRLVLIGTQVLRANRPGQRRALSALLSERRWAGLPGPSRSGAAAGSDVR